VSVCVPVVSDHGLIDTCLDGLAGSRPSVEIEVVVVANGLDDSGVSRLQKRDDIVLVTSAVNTGFSGGNNLAAQSARGPYLLFLNDDSVVEPGFIDRLLHTLERDPSVAAVGGAILSADGTLQEAGSVLWRDGWAAHVGAGLPSDSAEYHYVRYADYISANGLLVHRRAWDAVGGFDERYFPAYYEDVDLCLALWHRGYRVAYEPRAQLRHLESQSTSTSFRGYLLIRNRAQLVEKWSELLRGFPDHPDVIDDAAIEVAVERAARRIGRVLVLERSAEAGEWWLPTVEALAQTGWSVMLSAPLERKESDTGARMRNHLIDLGVDIRDERAEEVVSLYGDRLDAVVVAGESADVGSYLPRAFGSSLPLVGQGREDSPEVVVARVAAVVQQHLEMADFGDVVGAPEEPVATRGRSDRTIPTGDPSEITAAFRIAAPTDDEVQRDRKYAEADAGVRRDYTEYLEFELARTRAALDETDVSLRRTAQALEESVLKTKESMESLAERQRYIDSLSSVKAKKWILSRRPNRGS
jgi:GT2 family glycosyltransferase